MPGATRPRYTRDIESQEAGQDLGWHTHDFGQFFSAIRGSIYVGTRDRVLLLNRAMAVWIPPDVEHWLRYVSSNEIIYVDVNRAEADRLGTRARIVQMTPVLQALMGAVPASESSGLSKPHEAALYELLFHEIVAAKDIPLSIAMPRDKRISRLAQAAIDAPGSIASIDEWLIGASASRKTIERLFIKETGMTPSRWLRQIRILHAVTQLAAGKKISSVALDLGYQSPSAFTFMFRSAIGLSPRDFRQTEKSIGR
ncbi:helix-turn-helix transcriptional regulator [Brucella intermedia]|uniref:AraC family transcriptional regulator n=1 Tax=Brucella TaxID=234 RepID=UPI000AFA5536|nr:helix-turn-helix transcriptional regulator [Brucella intermedia]